MLSFEKQYQILSKGAVDLINKEEFLVKLKSEKKLKIKAGFDPSRPDLHVGHSILINKLRQFQELGHEVIFVVGDFTACIGDPSGQNKTRPALSPIEVQKNAKTYMEQATGENFKMSHDLDESDRKVLSFFKRLDREKTKIQYNSEWLDKLPLKEFILSICSKFTLARQLERNDFSLRHKAGKPIGLHEFFYPILQAYDSVQLAADVEIGGTDQTFNLLLGRELQKEYQQSPQVILTLPLLEGMDGSQKMSKSLNNAIAFNDSPKDIYGKIMKISDELMIKYWSLFTEGERDLRKDLRKESYHPKKEKERLAWLLVCAFYGKERANKEQEEFTKVFSKGFIPKDIPEKDPFDITARLIFEKMKEKNLNQENPDATMKNLDAIMENPAAIMENLDAIMENLTAMDELKIQDKDKTITHCLKNLGLASSLSEARRKIQEGAVKWSKSKWEYIHDLKVYLVYIKIKDGQKKHALIQELLKDNDFKGYIPESSIIMKIENYRYLDTNGKKGLKKYSQQSKEIYEKYKNSSIQKIEADFKNITGYLKHPEKITNPDKIISLEEPEEKITLRIGKRRFAVMKSKWEYIHDLKVYLVYRKIKDGQKKHALIQELLNDHKFKGYIPESSIIMKIENYRYLDTNEKKGLENASKQSKETYKNYKNSSIQEIEADVKKITRCLKHSEKITDPKHIISEEP